jgi:DMSO reductase family type II enzyme heme b subunit
MDRSSVKSLAVVLVLVVATLSFLSFARANEKSAVPVVKSGKSIYDKRCSHCHGIEGRGDGVAANLFRPRPANFSRGQFKYASTIKGELPTDEDLFITVSSGLPGTGMPAWGSVLSEGDIKLVVSHIKTFSKKFADRKEPPKLIDMGKKVSSSDESIAKGKELFFKKTDCARCHGVEGRADGANAKELSVWPRNLTKGWTFRRSNAPEEIFQRITRGIIVMPSFAKGETVETTEEERWHIANYVHSLSQYKGTPQPAETIVAKKIEGALTDDPDHAVWKETDQFYFPMIGQVTSEPRQFTPTIDAVIAKAIYNDKEVAILLTWDDATKSLVSDGAEGDDGIALQFPSAIRADERPYFIMGDPAYPVYVARLGASSVARTPVVSSDEEGQADTGVEAGTAATLDLVATSTEVAQVVTPVGAGTVAPMTIQELNAMGQEHNVGIRFIPQGPEGQQFVGKWVYKNGQYRAVFKRTLTTPDKNDLQFQPMQFIPVAFSAWDGSNGDVDSKRSISAWYYLLLKPADPPTRIIYPTLIAFLVIGLEWWIGSRYRKNKGDKV